MTRSIVFMPGWRSLVALAFVLLSTAGVAVGEPESTVDLGAADGRRTVVDLNFGWRFKQLDIVNDIAAAPETYGLGPDGLEAIGYDDTQWQIVDLPHDWAIDAGYAEDNLNQDRCGYVKGGVGWYRKTIDVPATWQRRRVRLEFDGAFRKTEVWVNGVCVGRRPYGWISFGFDISHAIRGSSKATIAVRLNNSFVSPARWYTGSGIYAPVRLVVSDKLHVPHSGTLVRSRLVGEQAEVSVNTEIQNDRDGSADAIVRTSIVDPVRIVVARTETPHTVERGTTGEIGQQLTVASPKLWSCETPSLYTALSEVVVDGKVVDRCETRFGIRTIEWETETGFWLNGRNVKLQGVCNHQDAGPFGAAVPDKVLRGRLGQLKAMGCNAVRTAHNPQTPAFYRMCDEMGILVMDEIFDGWGVKAAGDYGKLDFPDWWQRDVTDWMRRDRNHPCVVIWSLGNETSEAKCEVDEFGRKVMQLCHKLDPTRPVTAGTGHLTTGVLDVHGENGKSEKSGFVEEHAANLERPFVATEYPHTWQVRGFYNTKTWYRDGFPNKKQLPHEIADLRDEELFHLDWINPADKSPQESLRRKQIFNSSYDNATVRITARGAWQQVRDVPWWSGGFRWTGFDYLGEAGYVHGGWPFRAFMGGAIDLVNFEKDLFYMYQSQWTVEPMVHILPHWTHPEMTPGAEIPVWVYSNAEEVELLLGGKSLGRDRPGSEWSQMQCEWKVPWTPGELKAVAYRNGNVVAEAVQHTAAAPARIEITSDTPQLAADGYDVATVTVDVQDAQGRFYPYGENRIYFHLDGPGRLRLGNGDPVDTEPHVGVNSRRAFFGLARAFVESTRESGDVALVAAAIVGEKWQLTSNLVSIDVQEITLHGKPASSRFEIFYTTDGSTPTTHSKPYSGGFPVELGTTVKAIVVADGRKILEMEERFSTDEGLWWGKTAAARGLTEPAGSPATDQSEAIGTQAEGLLLEGSAKAQTKGTGFHGTGYVAFSGRPGSITAFVKNDGAVAPHRITVRYAGADSQGGRPMSLSINGKVAAPAVTLKNSGSWFDGKWSVWSTEQVIPQGSNEVKLSTAGRGGMFIDELTIEPIRGR